MKKLIMAAVIACTAVFANAASVNWYVGYIMDADGINLLGPSDTGYIALLNIYSDSAMTTLLTSGSLNSWDDGLTMDDSGSIVVDNSSDTTYYGQVIISYGGQELKSDGFQFDVTTLGNVYDIAIMTDPSEASGVQKIGGGDFDGANGVFEAAGGGGGWAPPVVPEPTTGLLVLRGVAGLALRRRRA